MEGYKMGLTARKRALNKLIEDSIELKISKKVINGYRSNLAEIEEELKKVKEAREKFKERLKDE